MKKYLNAIDYLSKVYWDNIMHQALTFCCSLMFGFAVFALSMAMVEMKPERIELVRRGRKNDEEPSEEELKERNNDRKAHQDYLHKHQLAF